MSLSYPSNHGPQADGGFVSTCESCTSPSLKGSRCGTCSSVDSSLIQKSHSHIQPLVSEEEPPTMIPKNRLIVWADLRTSIRRCPAPVLRMGTPSYSFPLLSAKGLSFLCVWVTIGPDLALEHMKSCAKGLLKMISLPCLCLCENDAWTVAAMLKWWGNTNELWMVEQEKNKGEKNKGSGIGDTMEPWLQILNCTPSCLSCGTRDDFSAETRTSETFCVL